MSQNGNWQGFVNIRLQAEHRKAVKALAKSLTEPDIVGKIWEYLDDGYKVTFSRDEENDAVICALTGNGSASHNCGYTMSQRHVDPVVAFAAVVYSHEELAQRDEWKAVEYDWRTDEW